MDPESLTLLIVDTSTEYKRAILKTPKSELRYVIPRGVDPAKYERAFGNGEGKTKKGKPKTFNKSNIPKLEATLEKIESMNLIKNYKFGVIYVKDGQNAENDIFGNDECSPDFWEFMDLIGNRIKLQGYTGYRGGLDVKSNETGIESYIAKYSYYSVMFHVAPLLPNQHDDLQKLERKRHVGNDVVVVVFLDRDRKEPFNPNILTSHFNSVFVIVKPVVKEDKVVGYSVNVALKPGINPFPPFIDGNAVNRNDIQKFMLRKCLLILTY